MFWVLKDKETETGKHMENFRLLSILFFKKKISACTKAVYYQKVSSAIAEESYFSWWYVVTFLKYLKHSCSQIDASLPQYSLNVSHKSFLDSTK